MILQHNNDLPNSPPPLPKIGGPFLTHCSPPLNCGRQIKLEKVKRQSQRNLRGTFFSPLMGEFLSVLLMPKEDVFDGTDKENILS